MANESRALPKGPHGEKRPAITADMLYPLSIPGVDTRKMAVGDAADLQDERLQVPIKMTR